MKRLIDLLLIMYTSLSVFAVPTNPRSFTVIQKDGSTLELRFVGDENYHYYSTIDGLALIKADEAYYYADITEDGRLMSSGILAHDASKRNIKEINFITSNRDKVLGKIRNTWSERLNKRNGERSESHARKVARRKAIGQPSTYIGKKKGIVILINYADRAMKTTSSRQAWDDQFNKKGYNKNNHLGSVRDYFYDQSYGKLEIDFDVVGPYTVSQGWRYYGKQNANGADIHPCQLVSEACKLADPDVNFKDYDWDGDGEVDQVFVVYAGYSAAAGYDEEAIWPHEWHLAYGSYYGDGPGAMRLDGVKIDNYALSSELNGVSGSTMDYIGTAVHEFSHCLGLPDFYDVDGNGTQCMDYWDVLDAGCYSGPNWKGEAPTGYTAYERNFAGWLKYEELTDPRKVVGLENLGDTARAFIYYNKANKNEYFILENRQAKRWFKYPVSAHGLFVYHVDYDRRLWENDRPNSDKNHPRMTYVPADKSFNRQTTGMMTSDFFPGTNSVRSLTNTSHESCYGKMFNKNSDGTYHTNMEITSITEAAGKITFTFNGGEAAVKTKLNNLIESVKAMVDVPHDDKQEGATQNLQLAISTAEETMASATTSAEYILAMDSLRQKAVDFLYVANPVDSLQPFDITFTFENTDIKNNEAWKEEIGNNAYSCSNNCGEYTNMRFTLSQTSSHRLPKGDYTATCHGFQKPASDDPDNGNTLYSYFYARTKSVKLKTIYDDAQETKVSLTDKQLTDNRYVPGDTKTARKYFDAGHYTNTVKFSNISDLGTSVKIGIKSTLAKANYWTCFSDFRLFFHGFKQEEESTAVMNVGTQTSPNDIYDLSGRKVSAAQTLSRGVYIVNGKKVFVR